MSKEKQIEEMAKDIWLKSDVLLGEAEIIAKTIYPLGYRKQSEGEWMKDEQSIFEHRYHCSVCNFYLIGVPTNHCPNCGAKMKGGAE